MSTDFDRTGLGIGGIGRHIDELIVPSDTAAKRISAKKRQGRRCCRCGQSDVFDGAMFTNDPSSGLCDDCY